jgi:hypothetical protein
MWEPTAQARIAVASPVGWEAALRRRAARDVEALRAAPDHLSTSPRSDLAFFLFRSIS